MEESNAPAEWNAMFSNVENNFAPWKFSPDERDKWAEEMRADSYANAYLNLSDFIYLY